VIVSWLRDAPGTLLDRARIRRRRFVPDQVIRRWMIDGP